MPGSAPGRPLETPLPVGQILLGGNREVGLDKRFILDDVLLRVPKPQVIMLFGVLLHLFARVPHF